MSTKLNLLKNSAVVLVTLALYGFSQHRASLRNPSEFTVNFIGEEKLYITYEAVNKLLIQKFGPLKNLAKDEVILDSIEETILANDMIKNAQVYSTVNGQLKANIVQRTPIGRVHGPAKYYLDDEGKHMPLSPFYAARVPMITGKVTEEALSDIYKLIGFVNKDGFLKKNIIGIKAVSDQTYQLRFRLDDFVIHLGSVENLSKKFTNFKAFYAKATKDKNLDAFSKVNLEFDNQIVCTKK